MNMHATMILFAICLPDWNSLDSVRRAHNDLEGVGLVFFALLVVSEALAHLSKDEKKKHAFDTLGVIFFAVAVLAEIVAYPYGQRNDTLSDQLIRSLGTVASDAKNSADGAAKDAEHATEAAASALNEAAKLEGKVEGNAKDVKDIKAKQADRILTITAADIDALRVFGAVKSRVMVNTGNPEANVLADQIYRLLGAADTKPFPVGEAMGSEELLYERGVHIRTPEKYRGIAEALRKILDREKISVDVSPLTVQDEILVSERSSDILAILVGPK